MKYYNLFLDDERVPSDVLAYKQNLIYNDLNWIVVRNYDQFVNMISEHYLEEVLPGKISFDHDLTKEHYEHGALSAFQSFDYTKVNTPTGWHCLKWALKFHQAHDIRLPEILFHSQNPGGIKNMAALLEIHNPIAKING